MFVLAYDSFSFKFFSLMKQNISWPEIGSYCRVGVTSDAVNGECRMLISLCATAAPDTGVLSSGEWRLSVKTCLHSAIMRSGLSDNDQSEGGVTGHWPMRGRGLAVTQTSRQSFVAKYNHCWIMLNPKYSAIASQLIWPQSIYGGLVLIFKSHFCRLVAR